MNCKIKLEEPFIYFFLNMMVKHTRSGAVTVILTRDKNT